MTTVDPQLQWTLETFDTFQAAAFSEGWAIFECDGSIAENATARSTS